MIQKFGVTVEVSLVPLALIAHDMVIKTKTDVLLKCKANLFSFLHCYHQNLHCYPPRQALSRGENISST